MSSCDGLQMFVIILMLLLGFMIYWVFKLDNLIDDYESGVKKPRRKDD